MTDEREQEAESEAESGSRGRKPDPIRAELRKREAELYVVVDESGSIRYAGVSKNAKIRQKIAWSSRYSKSNGLHVWLRSLTECPQVRILAVVEWPERMKTETRLILRLREHGFNLVNEIANYREVADTPESHRKQSESLRRYFENTEARQRLSESAKRRFEDPEQRRRLSEAQKLRYEKPEERRKSSESAKRANKDPERRRRQSELLLEIAKIPVMCDICGKGPFRGPYGLHIHQVRWCEARS
jgi:hypothetical protein